MVSCSLSYYIFAVLSLTGDHGPKFVEQYDKRRRIELYRDNEQERVIDEGSEPKEGRESRHWTEFNLN